MTKTLPSVACIVLLSAALPEAVSAATITANTNIFVAGQDSTGINTMGGLFPSVIQTFAAGPGKSVTFSVTPSLLSCGTGPCVNAGTGDGAGLLFASGPTTGTDLAANGTNGISGLIFHGREMFLVGVFLDNSTPTGPGPSTLTFVSSGGTLNADTATSFPAFALGQVFVIGDGRTGFNNAAGSLQTWAIPTNATRLFVGFADGFDNFVGLWGDYGNNTGALNVTATVLTDTPEPATVLLAGLGLIGLRCLRSFSTARKTHVA